MATDKPAPPILTYEAAQEFCEGYANNIYFEASAWDMKLIFGQLDQTEGKIKIVQHTAITLPWAQVKLMVYWLRGHIEAHELANGKVPMPDSIIPPEFPPLTEELRKLDPNADAVYAVFNRLRNELVATLKK